MEGHRVKLTEVNPYLVCVLCHGYLVDATTIAECLHSFCRSCIFRQLERKSICPICETHVHNTKLYRSLRPDKTLQDIVYKLVPGLFHNEMQRRRDFYKNHPYRDEHLEPECRGVGLDRLIYSPDDQISLSLEFYDDEREKEEWSNNSSPKPPQFAPSGPKRYLQCPAGFKMLHLKKFLRQKYGLSPSCNVDIMYRRECLPDSYSLMDVAYIYTWKRNSPMRFYYRMPDVIMKQLTAPPPEKPVAKSTNDDKQLTESVPKSPNKSNENKPEENKEVKKESNENIAKPAELVKIETPEKEKIDKENKEEEKQKTDEVVQPQGDTISSSRALSKQDELSVSVLLSLGQCRVDNKDEHKFAMPHPVTPKNGIIEKRNGKVSPKPSVNKIASDLAEHKAQQPQLQNSSPLVPPQNPLPTPNQQLNVSSQQKQQQIQQKQKQIQQMQQQKQKQQLKNQHLQQQKQQQFLHQKQQMHQLMQQQQQKLQQQIQQQHLLQQQQLQQIHLQQVQRHQLQQLHTQQPQILQLQVQPQLQLQQVIHQMKETKPLDQQPPQLQLQQQPVGEQPGTVANQAKPVANQILKIHQSPPVLLQSQVQQQPSQHLVQPQPAQLLVQQQQPQQPVRQQSPQHSVTQKPAQQLVQQPSTQPSVQQQLPQQPGQQQVPQQQTQQQQPQQLVTQQQSQQSVQQQQPQQLVQQQPSQPAVQSQSQQPLSQKTQNQQSQPQKSPQHQKSWPEPTTTENPSMNGKNSVQNPQVTLNTSNGSVTIMAQLKSPPMVPSPLGAAANSPGSPIPTMNGKSPETPRPQGIHQNLPRTVLPKSPFVNGKPLQKSIQQKNISGQRLNNNLPEGKNGLIQQSNINNRLPTFQKNGGTARKAGIPGGVISKTGPTLDQRIQQLYNSGQTNKPPSPGGKSESRLASWLNNRFKPQPVKEEPESTTPASPPSTKEVSMQRYKRKLQEMQKVQEICEITQENPKPDDAKRRREVTPDVSIELMRAADMKKIDTTKKEKRPMPGLKSIQEVGAKRKKEEDSALDLSKPGDMLRPQLPWLVSRPPHFIPSPRPT